MRKKNIIEIDNKGNVKLAFSGYEGNSCRIEEDKLRKYLESLGVSMEIEEIIPVKQELSQSTGIESKQTGRIKQ